MASPRSRSRSPTRSEPKPKKQKTSGFKWKEKKPKDSSDSYQIDERDGGALERGYRNRSPRREGHWEREGGRERDRKDYRKGSERDGYEDREREDNARRKEDASPAVAEATTDMNTTTSTSTTTQPPSVESKFGPLPPKTREAQPSNNSNTPSTTTKSSSTKPKKSKPKSTAPSEPMIIVNINDRLGTKAAIPCLASDSIRAFKAVVAAHIGRQPHEIMLKRQGERPFKDVLTLADYGVSNGVQLDLELDTGD